ncbi:complement regulator-acquiring protein [Borreliella afzelii]|uniref:Complement regulator acquiring protein 1 n=1 Tax=Borreliella afzelii TaxID=29518 RepID=A0AB34Z455_BORAF|nr:outer surface protein [Borreliella afzelii K78]MBB5141494.1 hypothetical protein [Borreliella afzelii]
MTKTKSDIIKLNIITTILALICISCAPINKIDPKPKKHTNAKEKTQNLFQESKDLAPLNQESKDLAPLNQESKDLAPSNQESKDLETILLELEAIGKKLEAQKKQEDEGIAKITAEQSDFLDTFKIGPLELVVKENQIEMKRIIYSSLNYETKKIKTLEEILEKLKKKSTNNQILGRFIHHISWSIQFRLNQHLKVIKDELLTLSQKEAEELLINVKSDLILKQRFKKTLNETIAAYNKNSESIKTNEDKLAAHMNENYEEFTSLKPI